MTTASAWCAQITTVWSATDAAIAALSAASRAACE
jgi:hypothetical protein